jgi:4-hydroxybenzoate polyprenyltransferase
MNFFFRINEWKNTHLLLVFTGFFIWVNYYDINDFYFLLITFSFLISITLLMGSFGYYINDVFDVTQDRIASKINFAARHKPIVKIFIPILLLLLVYVSWFYLSRLSTIFYLLFIEVFLFLIYSIPIIRVKERPILSILVDSFYAYVLWGVFNLVLIREIVSFDYEIYQYCYVLWLFFIGVRGILNHQITDFYNDLSSKTKTFAIKYGINTTLSIVKLWVIPLEFVAFLTFIFLIHPLLLLFYILSISIELYNKKTFQNLFDGRFLKQPLNLSVLFLDVFYYNYLPFILLLFLIIKDIYFLPLALFIGLFFFSRFKYFFQSIYLFVKTFIYPPIFKIGSFLVNYSLYYSFLLIGINLKKRAKRKRKPIIKKEQNAQLVSKNVHRKSYSEISRLKENNVHGLWIGNKLSNMELLTITSFIKHGYQFHLWIYDDLGNEYLPNELLICNANEIIPKEKIFYYKNKSQFGQGQGSVAGFSDIFRYKLLYEKGGWWVDMDVTCLRPFDSDGEYFFRAHNSLPLVGNVIKAPAKSQLMKMCYEQALKTIDENNRDWHKPIDILANNVLALGLSHYIYEEVSNTDEFYKFEKFYFLNVEIPETWVFIHWNNEILRTYGVMKDYSLSNSTYSQLLMKYGLLSRNEDYKKLDKIFKRKLLIANIKKVL